MVEQDLRIFPKNFSTITYYDLGELQFFLNKKICATAMQVFLILKNEKNVYEIVELVRKEGNTASLNMLFEPTVNQPIRFQKETITIQLLILYNSEGTYKFTSPLVLKLSTKNYELARQVYIVKEVENKIQDCYSKILAFSEAMTEKGDNTQ